MSFLREKRLAATLLTSVAVAGCSLLVAVLLAQTLGATGRGQVAAVLAPFFVVVWVFAGGVPYAVAAEERAAPPDVYAAVRGSGLQITAALGLLGTLVMIGWALVVGDDGLWSSYATAAVVLPFAMLLAVFVEYERQSGAGFYYNVARLLPSVGSALAVTVLFIEGTGPVSTFVAASVVPGAILLMVLVLLRVGVFRAPLLRWRWWAAGRLMRVAVRAWPSALTDTLLLRVDQVALSILTEARGLGLYAVAATISEASGFLRAGICATEFASLAAAPHDGLGARRRHLHIRVLIATVPVYAVVGLVTHEFANRIFGDDFRDIGTLVVVLLGAQIALDAHLTGGTLLLAIDRPGAFSKASIGGLTVHVIVLFPAAFFAGASGAAYASLVGYAAAASLSVTACNKAIKAKGRYL